MKMRSRNEMQVSPAAQKERGLTLFLPCFIFQEVLFWTTIRNNHKILIGTPIMIYSLLIGQGVDLGSDTIQVTTTLRAQSAASIGVLLDQFQLFQILEGLAGNGTGTSSPVTGGASVVAANWNKQNWWINYKLFFFFKKVMTWFFRALKTLFFYQNLKKILRFAQIRP